MNMNDVKLNKFMQSIQNDARERREKILAKAAEFSREEMEKAEDQALNDSYLFIHYQSEKGRNEVMSEYSKKELEERKNLLNLRNNISNKVFKEAFNKLIEFTKTDEYKDYFFNNLKDSSLLFKNSSPQIFIKQDDKKYEDLIKSVFINNYSIEISDKIKIGGFLIKCDEKSIVLDETLDTKLDEQHDWFEKNSGLSIY